MASKKTTKKVAPRLYVTAAMLEAKGACAVHLDIFRRTFGEGRVFFNRANWNKANWAGLSVSFLFDKFLSEAEKDEADARYWSTVRLTWEDAMYDAIEAKRKRMAQEVRA